MKSSKLPVEGGEFAVEAVGLAGAFPDGEHQQTELAGKLRLVHHLTEQLSQCNNSIISCIVTQLFIYILQTEYISSKHTQTGFK